MILAWKTFRADMTGCCVHIISALVGSLLSSSAPWGTFKMSEPWNGPSRDQKEGGLLNEVTYQWPFTLSLCLSRTVNLALPWSMLSGLGLWGRRDNTNGPPGQWTRARRSGPHFSSAPATLGWATPFPFLSFNVPICWKCLPPTAVGRALGKLCGFP